jgi:hypothetical protein
VVLIDISAWKEPLQGLVGSIRNAVGDPMIIALLNAANAETILAALRCWSARWCLSALRVGGP